jgi:16S rRNA (cytidine1402-2'-O)-methyltransferase
MPYLNLQATLILYEAPHRLAATLGTLLEVVGDKRAVLAKELTKQHETYVRGSLSELAQYSEEVAPKGEYVIVLDNRGSVRQSAEEEIDAHALAVQFVRTRMMEGERHKAAVQEAVTRFSVNRRELYNATLGDEE